MASVDRIGDWMQTYTGRMFWPMDPRPEEICIEDIAHSLSMQCRYAGHCIEFYSVAEHCCLLFDCAPPQFKKWALLHDASEAYLCDVPRPLKPFLTNYKEAEQKVMEAVRLKFKLPPEPSEVKELDNRILADELVQNMRPPPQPWNVGPPLYVSLQLWSPVRAENEFIKRAKEIL